MQEVGTVARLRAAVADLRRAGATIGLVPTMGALHPGHLDLVRRGSCEADAVVVSIFVNPTQFERADDLAAYPRDLDGDRAALRGLGELTPDLLYVPEVAQMYPAGDPAVRVTVGGGLTDRLCGASRPGHFDGVATVVTKLLNQVGPDVAVFGRKDRQQLQVIHRLVADLDLPVRIVGVPTAREPDGLAISSRNRRLTAEQRRQATVLARALANAVELARAARRDGRPLELDQLHDALAAAFAVVPGARVDYLEVVEPDTLVPPVPAAVPPDTRLVVAVAAEVGPVRLIDNVELGDPDDEDRLLAAVRARPQEA